jgi:sugar phosphate isomerase/epimerase
VGGLAKAVDAESAAPAEINLIRVIRENLRLTELTFQVDGDESHMARANCMVSVEAPGFLCWCGREGTPERNDLLQSFVLPAVLRKSMPRTNAGAVGADQSSRQMRADAPRCDIFCFKIMTSDKVSRRTFLAVTAATPIVSAAARGKKLPVGLELFSVRNELQKDLMGTVRAVAKMGYDCVEFFSPYFAWTPDYAKQVRQMMDDSGIRCLSTHNGGESFTPEGLSHAIELNHIIGSQFIVLASAGRVTTLDGWKEVATKLNVGAEKMKPAGLRAGYHNHQLEFTPIEGKRPIEVLAANTKPDVMLQLDVGTCIEAGSDPVAWIKQNPGRIRSMHCKDWNKEQGYKVLVGEGVAPWKKLFEAAEKGGGLEFYLVEQEGSRYPELETAERCLANFRKLHG